MLTMLTECCAPWNVQSRRVGHVSQHPSSDFVRSSGGQSITGHETRVHREVPDCKQTRGWSQRLTLYCLTISITGYSPPAQGAEEQ